MKKFVLFIAVICLSVNIHAQYAWRLILPRLSYTVQINPLDPNKLYVGNTFDQLWRSNDGGGSWERTIMTEFPSDERMQSMVVSSADTSVILYGGFFSSGIKRSDNGGVTASKVHDAPTGVSYYISEAIVEDPSNPSTLYAARGWPLKSYTEIYESTDIGLTWNLISRIDTTKTRGLCTIAIRPDSTNILFVGAKTGAIFKSTDRGRTFKQVPVDGGNVMIFEDSEIPKIVFSPVDPLVAYAVVAFSDSEKIIGNGGLLKTIDGGESWNRIAYADTSLWAVEVRASSIGTDDVFIGGFKFTYNESQIPGDSLVARSLDGGETWSRFTNITWQPNEGGDTVANVWVLRYSKAANKLYMATDLGLYVFDEPVNVKTEVVTHATLRATLAHDVLSVVDTESARSDNTWTVYNMQGAAVATGHVGSSNALELSVSPFPAGAYVMTWGNDQKFRTVSFVIAR